MSGKITLGHGSGGKLTQRLIDEVFKPHLHSIALDEADDAAVVTLGSERTGDHDRRFYGSAPVFPGGRHRQTRRMRYGE